MEQRTSSHRFPGPGSLERALALVRFLRAECPWDRAQTARSLVPHLLEEAHEVADAVHEGRVGALAGELGDLLLNLAFQIVVHEEQAILDAEEVYAALETKMVERHPHLFGDGPEEPWEAIKARGRPDRNGVLAGLPRNLDPLTKGYRIQERVSSVGFDWPDHRGPLEKVREELEEARSAIESEDRERAEEELGDLLFAVVNLVRLSGAHPTTALARANRKFATRFERVEALAAARGIRLADAGLDELDRLWDEVKDAERHDGWTSQ